VIADGAKFAPGARNPTRGTGRPARRGAKLPGGSVRRIWWGMRPALAGGIGSFHVHGRRYYSRRLRGSSTALATDLRRRRKPDTRPARFGRDWSASRGGGLTTAAGFRNTPEAEGGLPGAVAPQRRWSGFAADLKAARTKTRWLGATPERRSGDGRIGADTGFATPIWRAWRDRDGLRRSPDDDARPWQALLATPNRRA